MTQGQRELSQTIKDKELRRLSISFFVFNIHLRALDHLPPTLKVVTMLARLAIIALTLTLAVALPANFETDPMLQVGQKAASSYAERKRAHFETDPMLQVGEKAASSYAESD
ncbi:hypothetical protein F4861DRAFT_540744 [Xylaria intraflava]|nr:hypothetical protein F4861DRAFT_540744 [Xylaria intraflava]